MSEHVIDDARDFVRGGRDGYGSAVTNINVSAINKGIESWRGFIPLLPFGIWVDSYLWVVTRG